MPGEAGCSGKAASGLLMHQVQDNYSEDCQAMANDEAKARLTHADIAAVAEEMRIQFKPEQPMVGWEGGPVRGV